MFNNRFGLLDVAHIFKLLLHADVTLCVDSMTWTNVDTWLGYSNHLIY